MGEKRAGRQDTWQWTAADLAGWTVTDHDEMAMKGMAKPSRIKTKSEKTLENYDPVIKRDQTWQWKMDHLQVMFPRQAPFIRDFPLPCLMRG